MLPTITLVASFVLALAGQHGLAAGWRWTPWCLGGGVLLFLLVIALARGKSALPVDPPRSPLARDPVVRPAALRGLLVAASAILALIAYRSLGGNAFTRTGVICWVGSAVASILACADRPRRLSNGTARRFPFDRAHAVGLFAALAVAIFFRTYRLGDVPAEMVSDHAEKLLDVNDVLQGARPIYFPRNTGREAMQFYLTAALVRFTPLELGHLALKAGCAIPGIAAVPATYLLAAEMYGGAVGALAAALLAFSHWHVTITRVGLRFPFPVPFALLSLFFLLRAFRHGRRNDWLACGCALGVGQHTYIPIRIVPLLLMLLVACKVAFDASTSRRASPPVDAPWAETTSLRADFWIGAVAAGWSSLILFIPLLRFWHDYPTIFWYRAFSRSSDWEQQLPGGAWSVFWGNVQNAYLMFNLRGDVAWVNNIPGSPHLDAITASLFLLGSVLLVWRLVRHGDRRSVYLMVALFILMLPSTLSLAFPVENPGAARMGSVAPIAAIIAALPLQLIVAATGALFPRSRLVPAAVLAAVLLPAGVANFRWYFQDYDRQYRESAWNSTEMGAAVRAFLKQGGDLEHVWHVAWPYWVDTRNIVINAANTVEWHEAISIGDTRAFDRQRSDPAPKLYLLSVEDEKSLDHLRSVFPEGASRRYRSAVRGHDFMLFTVPGAAREHPTPR